MLTLSSRIMRWILPIVFFCALLAYFTHPIKTVSDFWWHISTGRWIVENGQLPYEDPFSYTAANEPDARRDTILKGYWLAQVIYYGIYRLSGYTGLIFFDAFVLTLSLVVLWIVMRRRGMDDLPALALISALPVFLRLFESIRPQEFSFLGVLLTFWLLEHGVNGLRTRGRLSPFAWVLPFVLCVWASLHPGFVLGLCMGGIYLIVEAGQNIREPVKRGIRTTRSLGIWLGLSFLASFVNPNHLRPLGIAFGAFAKEDFTGWVDEYAPAIKYLSYYGYTWELAALTIVFIITFGALIPSWKRVRLTEGLLYGGFALAGISSFRFSVFFMLMAPALTAPHIGNALRRAPSIGKRAAGAIVLIASLVLFNHAYRESFLARGLFSNDLPSKAVDYLVQKNLLGPIFNPYEWGGYLMWRLYPREKVFVDARTLDLEQLENYSAVLSGNKTEVFERYGIKTVIFMPYDDSNERVPGIVQSMLIDGDWVLVYWDGPATVFAHRDAAVGMKRIDKRHLTDSLFRLVQTKSMGNPGNIKHYLTLGVLSRIKGEYRQAEEYFRKALMLEPGNTYALNWIEALKKYQ